MSAIVLLPSLSELLSSFPFSCPSTGTSISTFPPGRSGSSIVTVIGPSTFVPGVTITFPSLSISTGTSLPSSSLAVTFVSSSLFSTLMPVSCLSSVGLTGLTSPPTFVFLSSGVGSVTVISTLTSSVDPSG